MSTRAHASGMRSRRLRLIADDRRIIALAVPALGALAAEPLYVLVDTVIVGHLGVTQLAALALAGAVLSAVVSLCNFLAYGCTPTVGRLHASGEAEAAAHVGQQAMLLALGLGVLLTTITASAASPLMDVMSGGGAIASAAATYTRIAALGLPFALLAVAGQGYLRGVSRLRLPLVLLLAGNLLNLVLEVLFVYGLHLGLAGSAWATVLAQCVMAAGFLVVMRPGTLHAWRVDPRTQRSLAKTGSEIFIRTTSLFATFLLAGAILAHVGATSLAAHQVAFQLWMFLALTLDALAIAAQVLVSQQLGIGRIADARRLATRTIVWSVLAGTLLGGAMLALGGVLPRLFTTNNAVLTRIWEIWPIFALMQPVNGAVFALDGILLGAGDTRYLMRAMLASALIFAPLAVASLLLGWGIVGVWLAILAFVIARLLTCGQRFWSERWALTELSPERAAA
jgi:putative MATE family efflux protein